MSIDVTTFALLRNEIKKSKIDISNSSVGQTIVVKAVDDTGKPIAWEPVDFPTDDHINYLINTALGVIENGTY